MIKTYLLIAFATTMFLIVSCHDSTIDPGNDNGAGSPKYVFYTKSKEWKFYGYRLPSFQVRRINLQTRKDVLIADSSILSGVCGNQVYYIATSRTSMDTVELRRCDMDGKSDRLMCNWYANKQRYFILSPDGSKMIYASMGINEVYCSDTDHNNNIKIFSTVVNNNIPLTIATFAADSKKIGIIDSYGYLVYNLYTCNIDGSDLKLQDSIRGEGQMLGGLSPDGMSFAYISYDSIYTNSFKIAIVDFQKHTKKIVTEHNKMVINITWSHDGSKLAYYTDPGKFFIIDTSGSNKKQITNLLSYDSYFWGFRPDWSSDCKRILFINSTNIDDLWNVNLGNLKLFNLETEELETLIKDEIVLNAFFY